MSSPDPLIGRKLGDYTIQRLLGRGGMSRVYLGYDENLQRYAAVKVISGDFATTTEEEYTRRFQSEARAIARLQHPNIVGIYQFGRTEGIYYMAQVFMEGKDLRTLLKSYADKDLRMPASEVLRLVRDVAEALDYAHEQGVIHRDIKPSNIMLEKKTGRAILMDFGLALSVHEGTMGDTFGSAHYIAPEQAISSAKALPQSDLYSLGIVIYEMLAGKVPFDDPSVMSVALKHLNEVPPPPTMYNPDLPPAVEAVIMRVLDKDPKRRHANGHELSEALEQAYAGAKPSAETQAVEGAPVIDMLASRPSRPTGAAGIVEQKGISQPQVASPPAVPKTGQQGLAGRFARRKARKEEEAVLESLDEDSLQIDDATLNSILKAYEDPSEIGLVGPDAKGITLPEKPPDKDQVLVTSSRVDAPSFPAPPVSQKKRRSRVGLLLSLILVLAVLGIGVVFGPDLIGGSNEEDGEPSAALSPEEQTQTAVAMQALTGTLSTRAPTNQPKTATTPAGSVQVPAGTATTEPNLRMIYNEDEFLLINISDQTLDVSRLIFEQDGGKRKLEASRWDTADAVARPSEMGPNGCYQFAQWATHEPPSRDICPHLWGWYASSVETRFFWTSDRPGTEFTVRFSGETTPLVTCQIRVGAEGECTLYIEPGQTESSPEPVATEAAIQPSRTPLATPTDTLTPTKSPTATTVARTDTPEPPGAPMVTKTLPPTDTAVSTDAPEPINTPAATKTLTPTTPPPTDTPVPTDTPASPTTTYTPTKSPTRTPVPPDPNVKLIYNNREIFLINISRRTINVSNLVFEQELPDGEILSYAARLWDEQATLAEPTSAMGGLDGCYQLVTPQGDRLFTSSPLCPRFLGTFQTGVTSRHFWIADRPGAEFTVHFAGEEEPLATCPIILGQENECLFYLPRQ